MLCSENSFSAQGFNRKNVTWKIDEKNFGKVTTDSAGKFSIVAKSESYEKFEKIYLNTDKKAYEASLNGALIIKIDQDECAQ